MTKFNHLGTDTISSSSIREIVFGVEDGMVSTLGAITGIAIGSHDHYTVILAGLVIISVESISMGIGSYLSNQTEDDVNQRKIVEEKQEIKTFPDEEKNELEDMYVRDGWPRALAKQMSRVASLDKKLMLTEMTYREHTLSRNGPSSPVKNGIYMYLSYIMGGLVPLFSYFILPVSHAVPISIGITLIGLFTLGATTTIFTNGSIVKSGLRILLLGTVALVMGYVIGALASLLQ